jgi:peroxiredoxin
MGFRSLPWAWVFLCILTLGGLAAPALAVEVGDVAPGFTLYDVESLQHSLAAYTSHPVLLAFFGHEDPNSISIAPSIQSAFHEAFESRGLIVLGIECTGGSREQVESFSDETGALYSLLLNGGPTRAVYDVPVNSFVLIDTSSTVRYISLGPGAGGYNEAAMRIAVERALREANTTKTATWGLIKNLYK